MIDRTNAPDLKRLKQIMQVVEKESKALEDVRQRLFLQGKVTEGWLSDIENRPQDADMLESFSARFGRMQDTMGDKLFPRFLALLGEKSGAMIDNLNRLERLQYVSDAAKWLEMRQLRNKLIHEYVEDVGVFAHSLNQANQYTDELLSVFHKISKSLQEKYS